MKHNTKFFLLSLIVFVVIFYSPQIILRLQYNHLNIISASLGLIIVIVTNLIYGWNSLKYPRQIGHSDILTKIAGEHILFQNNNKDERLLISLFENYTDGFWIEDLNKIIKYSNPAINSLLGYTQEELSGKSITELIPDSLWCKYFEKIDTSTETNHDNYEIECVKKDGNIVNINISTTQILDSKGKRHGYYSIIKNISDLKNSESRIKTSKERFNLVFKFFPELLWIMDTKTLIKFEAPSVSRALGYEENYFIGKYLLDYIHPEELDLVIAKLEANTINNNEHLLIEFRFKHTNGSWICLEATGNNMIDIPGIEGIMIIAKDITEKRKSAAETRELQKIINRSPAVAFAWNKIKNHPVEYVSENCLQLTGYSKAEFLTGDIMYRAIIHPDDIERVLDEVITYSADSMIHKVKHQPYRIITKNGEQKWVSDSTEIKRGTEGDIQFYHGIVIDITERMEATLALKESEKRYKTLIETSPIPSIVHYDGQVVFLNSSAIKILNGSSIKDFIGKSVMEFVHPDFHDIVKNRINDVYSNYKNAELLEEKFITLTGKVIDVTVMSSIIEYKDKYAALIVFQDITDSKKAKEELQLSEKRYHELFSSVIEGLCLADKDNIVEFCNTAMAEIFEEKDVYSMVGSNLHDYVLSECKSQVESETAKRKSGVSSQYEIAIKSAKDNKKILLVSVSPRFNNEDTFIGTFGSVMDITEFKHLQDLTNRAQRLETAGRIAGQVAHDFNNLLAPLMAYPELIKSDLPKNHPAGQYLDDIEYAAEQMAEINQQLLTLGRRGHYNLVPLNLNKIVYQITNQITPMPKSLNLVLDIDEGIMPIKGGPSQIYRVILNLLNNARNAMLDVGVLTAKTENIYIDKLTGKFGSVPQGEYVRLTISDTGTGIPDEIIPKILDPFFTTKAPGIKKGSGLGLSIVNTVMEDHKGYIDLESQLDRGTDFYLYFPIIREQIEEVSEEQIVGGNEKILVVDDDSIQRTVAVRLLTKLGYQASAVNDGISAVNCIKDNPHDLIVLDMIMPEGIDGMETYLKMLEINPSQKAIIVSGYAESDRIKILLNLGVGAYIRKPLTYKSLAIAVRRELDRKTVQDKLVKAE